MTSALAWAAGAGAVRDVLTRPTGKHTFNSEWFTPSAGFAGGALSVCTLGARLTTLELLFPPVLGVAEDGLAAIASHCRALRNLQLDFRRLERHRGLFDWAAEDTTTLVDIVRSCSLLRELGIRSCGSLSDAALGCTADVLGSRLLRLGIENCTALTMRSVRHVGRVSPPRRAAPRFFHLRAEKGGAYSRCFSTGRVAATWRRYHARC